ncbi:hypothetical protein C0Q70_07335 [Pomacea canaliculata]|uniref:Leucine-rich repeat-containing protein 14 n=1 Tax=Pomacea canaliculata TaxID=400727 RepID=A0A2T7PER3_POMCA|nr:uncharacterized protein LOC112561292 [Pomacea canaliculata]PVD31909.1 hypothetical protein C0Q70_07335 [Pomacea canaliculata]
MFKALDYVNYDQLQVNARKASDVGQERLPTNLLRSASLQELCCDAINDSADISLGCQDILVSAVKVLPQHLLPMLLRVAIDNHQCTAVSTIISCWPHHTLSFREVLGTARYGDLFQDEMGFDLVVFRGILTRKKCCKMRCLDFQGFKLNRTFCKLIVQMWPLISLKKQQMNTKRLATIIVKNAGFEDDKAFSENLPTLLKNTLDSILSRYKDIHINIPRGKKLIIKLDTLFFTSGDNFYLDYLVSNCLRSITPVQIKVSNIHIRSGAFSFPCEMSELFTPFMVIHGHEAETLEGLSLRQLEDSLFMVLSSQLKKFTNLRALDIQDCSIYLQEGRTRSRTASRLRITELFSSFSRLTRLDLSFNYILGCLGELLHSLSCPLEYLALRGCDLDESDLQALASSKHAASLRELNLSKLCQVVFFYQGRIPPSALVSILRHFPLLAILNLSQNHIPNSLISELCSVLRFHLPKLKVLDISANVFLPEHQIDITAACASIPCMQKLRLTTVTSFLQEFGGVGRGGAKEAPSIVRILQTLEDLGRQDLVVETVNLSRAIFIDVVDEFNL